MRWPYILSLFFLAGATLLLIFNILCGATTHSVIGKWYWLEADTSSIPGAQPITRWTNYASCGIRGNKNSDCSSKSIAYPMSPVLNFGTTQGVPSGLTKKRGTIYFLSKVGWVFLLIGVIFTLMAFLPVAISFCVPSLTILNVITSLATNAALCFTALSAALLTAGYIKARNDFRDAGKDASVGKTMFAFVWTSVFLLLLSSILSGAGCLGNFMKKRKDKKQRESNGYETDSSSHNTYGNNQVHEKTNEQGGFFSRKKKSNKYDEENVGDSDYPAGKSAPYGKNNYNTRSINRPAEKTYNDHNAQYANAGYNANTGTAAATAGLAGATAGATASSSKDNNHAQSEPHGYLGGSGTSKSRDITSDGTQNYKGYNDTTGNSYNNNGYDYASGSNYPKKADKDVVYSDPYGQTGQNDLTGQKDYYSQGGYAHADSNYYTGAQTTADPTAAQTLKSRDVPNVNEHDSQRNYEHDSSKDGSANQGLWSTAAAVLGFGAATGASESKDTDTNDKQTQDINDTEKTAYKSREVGNANDEKYYEKTSDNQYPVESHKSKNHVSASQGVSGKQTRFENNDLHDSKDVSAPSNSGYSTAGQSSGYTNKGSSYENKSTVLPVASTSQRSGYTNQGGENSGEAEYIITDRDYNVLAASDVDLASGYQPTDYYTTHVDDGYESSPKSKSTKKDITPTSKSTTDNNTYSSNKNSTSSAAKAGIVGAGTGYAASKATSTPKSTPKSTSKSTSKSTDSASKPTDGYQNASNVKSSKKNITTTSDYSNVNPNAYSTTDETATTGKAGAIGAGALGAGAGYTASKATSTPKSSTSKSEKYQNVGSNSSSDPSYDYKQHYLNTTEDYSSTPSQGGYNDSYSKPSTGTKLHDVTEVSNYHTPVEEKEYPIGEHASTYNKSRTTGSNKGVANAHTLDPTYKDSSDYSSSKNTGYDTSNPYETSTGKTDTSSNDGKAKAGLLATTLGYIGVSNSQPSNSTSTYDDSSYGKTTTDDYDSSYRVKNKTSDDDNLVDDIRKSSKNESKGTGSSYTKPSTTTRSPIIAVTPVTKSTSPTAKTTKSSSVSSDSSTGKKAGLLATTLGYIGISSAGQNEDEETYDEEAYDDEPYSSKKDASVGTDSSYRGTDTYKHQKTNSAGRYTLNDLDDVDTTSGSHNDGYKQAVKKDILTSKPTKKDQSNTGYYSGSKDREGSYGGVKNYETSDDKTRKSSSGSNANAGLLATTLGYIGVSNSKSDSPTTDSTHPVTEDKSAQYSSAGYGTTPQTGYGKTSYTKDTTPVYKSEKTRSYDYDDDSSNYSSTPNASSTKLGKDTTTDTTSNSDGIPPSVAGLVEKNKNPYREAAKSSSKYTSNSTYGDSNDTYQSSGNTLKTDGKKSTIGDTAKIAAVGAAVNNTNPYKSSSATKDTTRTTYSSSAGHNRKGSYPDSSFGDKYAVYDTTESGTTTSGIAGKNTNPYTGVGSKSATTEKTSTDTTSNSGAAGGGILSGISQKISDTLSKDTSSTDSTPVNASAKKDSRTTYTEEDGGRSQRIADKQYGAFSLSNKRSSATPSIPGGFVEPDSPTASHFGANDSSNYKISKANDGVYGASANPRSTTELGLADEDATGEKGFVETVIERAKNII